MVTSFTDWDRGLYLAHHGAKGMHWGMRRYQNEDGSLTPLGRQHYGVGEGGNKRLSRRFNRETRKLNRLERRADVDYQAAKAKQYSTKAKIAGAGALGLATAAAGSHAGTVTGITQQIGSWKNHYDYYDNAASRSLKWMSENAGKNAFGFDHVSKRARSEIGEMDRALNNVSNLKKQASYTTAPVSMTTKVIAGAAAVAGGYAAYSAIRSKIAKARTTDEGHQKAVQKYEQQYSKMVKQFADTPYSELLKNQKKKA